MKSDKIDMFIHALLFYILSFVAISFSSYSHHLEFKIYFATIGIIALFNGFKYDGLFKFLTFKK